MKYDVLYKKLKELEYKYRDKLDIPDDVTFGIEIEFANALMDDVRNKIYKFYGIPSEESNYSMWKVVNDTTVQMRDSSLRTFGGEINSPILSNNNKAWREISGICDILNDTTNISISENCAFHIHIGSNIFDKGMVEIGNLLKLWMLYEDVIYYFGYGKSKYGRNIIMNFAAPINKKIFEVIDLINLNHWNGDDEFFRFYSKIRREGLSLWYLNNGYDSIKNTFEIRCPNGTLDKFIMQNNVNFFVNLFNYAKCDNFDSELINYELRSFNTMEISDFNHINIDKASRLADLIFKSEIDRLYFLRQYLKLFDSKNIKRKELIKNF